MGELVEIYFLYLAFFTLQIFTYILDIFFYFIMYSMFCQVKSEMNESYWMYKFD